MNNKSEKIGLISKETILKLASIADELHDHIAAGEAPISAFIKLARKHGLPSEQLRLLVRDWNTSNVLEKLATLKDLESRLRDLPVVYYDEIMEKVASELNNNSDEVDPIYYTVPDHETKPAKLINKSYADKLAGYSPMVPEEKSPVWELEENLDILIREVQIMKAAFISKLAALQRALEVSKAPPEYIIENIRVVEPGAEGIIVKVAQRIYRRPEGYYELEPYNPSNPVYKLASECVKIAKLIALSKQVVESIFGREKIVQASEANNSSEGEPPLIKDKIKEKGNEKEEAERPPPLIENKRTEEKKKKEEAEKLLKPVSEFPEEALGQFAKEVEEFVETSVKGLKSPKELAVEIEKKKVPYLEGVRRAINEQTLITSLIAEDPILGNYSPDSVFAAYDELYSLAPRAMQNAGVARNLLKKYLAQGGVLDLYDLKLLKDIERKGSVYAE